MKTNDISKKDDIFDYLEVIAKKIGKKTHLLSQDPKLFVEEIKNKASSLLTQIFKGNSRQVSPEFLRDQIKKQVKKNLTGRFYDDELVEAVTDSLVNVARADPYYSYLLGVEENIV